MEKVKKPLGGSLLALGIICAFWGINRMNSPVSQLASVFGQTDSSGISAIVIGSGTAIGGAVLLFSGPGKKD
jgi:Protein of unknown function (DUF3185)